LTIEGNVPCVQSTLEKKMTRKKRRTGMTMRKKRTN
jgi:hypothetical protein